MVQEQRLKLAGQPDQLFAASGYPKPFEFNHDVAAVFDDMVSRSVPLYADVTTHAARWALRFYQPQTALLDIGCSTATLLELVATASASPMHLVGIDNSEGMLDKAREKLSSISAAHQWELHCADVSRAPLPRASVVVMNYTLQFIPVVERKALMQRIYDALVPGGLLFISEKTRGVCPEFQETTTLFYEEFKRRQGYSDNEIARKKEALENVLVPFTEPELRRLLSQIGFSHMDSVLKWNNFVSIVALKDA